MSKTGLFLLITLITGFAFFQKVKACSVAVYNYPSVTDTCYADTDSVRLATDPVAEKTISSTVASPKEFVKKRIIYALFSLPFPCGFVGAHRVMLGTNPWIPVVYVATFGGCFGLLPLIDFCFITFSKDITPYENNPHVFMWIK